MIEKVILNQELITCEYGFDLLIPWIKFKFF